MGTDERAIPPVDAPDPLFLPDDGTDFGAIDAHIVDDLAEDDEDTTQDQDRDISL